mmetsp:Transcript_103209/g.301022  ORF Transcript_103209/g.301022 Transcript_103209/m.301022 type:complete len:94 (+) Transcript_103209:758-1039(+)
MNVLIFYLAVGLLQKLFQNLKTFNQACSADLSLLRDVICGYAGRGNPSRISFQKHITHFHQMANCISWSIHSESAAHSSKLPPTDSSDHTNTA